MKRSPTSPYKFINVVGIDGSGKTTLCKGLLPHIPPAKYVHAYHEPLFLKPIKKIAQFIFMRGTDEFSDYTSYRDRKSVASYSHKMLTQLYGAVWLLDYILQALWQVALPLILKRNIIVDRYVYDTVVNVSLTTHLSFEHMCIWIDLILKILPNPDSIMLVDVPEDIAFERKNDIQSVKYLKERRLLYLRVADRYGFKILDGTLKPKELLSEMLTMLKNYTSG